MKKILVEVNISSQKCSTSIMTIVAKLDGVQSIKLNEKKNRLTVVGDVDPVSIIEAIRKKKKHAKIVSVGLAEPEREMSIAGYHPYYNCGSTYMPVHPYYNWSDSYMLAPYVSGAGPYQYDEQPTGCVIV